MLQLQVREVDICRISKLIAKYNIKASLTNQVITLESKISDELLSELCNSVTICTVQNFSSKVNTITHEKLKVSNVEEPATNKFEEEAIVESSNKEVVSVTKQVEEETIGEPYNEEVVPTPQVMKTYKLIYFKVRRGEVYWCDFGEPYGCEQGGIRPVIVIQNDKGNLSSPCTIVLSCTAQHKKILPTHKELDFLNETILNCEESDSKLKSTVVLAEQIKTVDKTRLRKYIGNISSRYMDELQEIIDNSLQLKRIQGVISETENPNIDKQIDSHVPKENKDLNMVQIQLLSMVNIEELFKISKTRVSDEIKSEKILQLFGFDMQKNGVQYLLKAIFISPKYAYFNLETLCESISENEPDIEKDEIKRLIVARVKERFKFKKSPTIDFIRLVNIFLSKKEDEQNEEINI